VSDLNRYGSVRRFQDFLRQNALTFACAESCTGGLLSSEMTSVPGSSDVFWGGVVSYANSAKTSLLGVAPELIAAEGAVSAAVALAMVDGLTVSGVPLAVSTTGIAGPGGGSAEKPVGTVWFGLSAFRGVRKTAAVQLRLNGKRLHIQKVAARWARVLSAVWWESGMELDCLRSLFNNDGKLFVAALVGPLFSPTPLKPFPSKTS
jgi:PncC family amidohydrolase